MRQKANQRPLFCVLNGMASSWIDSSEAGQVIQRNLPAGVGTSLA